MKHVLLEGSEQWTLMTKEHYDAYISDARNQWTFKAHNGFESTEDVLSYIEQFFKLNRNDIEIINNKTNAVLK
jgi:hypothetical protein